ncbi:hypothetical protein IAU59_001382 [Kwoniella sp. CBS 9459]
MSNAFGPPNTGFGSHPSNHGKNDSPPQALETRQRYAPPQEQSQPEKIQQYRDTRSLPPNPSSQPESRQQPRGGRPIQRGTSISHSADDAPHSQGRQSAGTRYDRPSDQPVTSFGSAQPGLRSALRERHPETENDENRLPSSSPLSIPTREKASQIFPGMVTTDHQGQSARQLPLSSDYPGDIPSNNAWDRLSRPSQTTSAVRPHPRGISHPDWAGGPNDQRQLQSRRSESLTADYPMGLTITPAQGALDTMTGPPQFVTRARSRSVSLSAPMTSRFESHRHPSETFLAENDVAGEIDNLAAFDRFAERRLGHITESVSKIHAEKSLFREALGSAFESNISLKEERTQRERELVQARQRVQDIRNKANTLGKQFRQVLQNHESAAEALLETEKESRKKLKEELEEMRAFREADKKTIDLLVAKTEDLTRINSCVRKTVNTLGQDVTEFTVLAEHLIEARKEKKLAESLVEAKEKELCEAQIANVGLEEKVKHWEDHWGPDLTELKEKVGKLHSKSEDISPGLQTALEINQDLQAKLEAKEKELQHAIRAREEAETSRDTYLDRIHESEEFIKARGYDADDIETIIAQMEEKNMAELKGLAASRDKEIENYGYRVRALTAEIKSLEKQVSEIDRLREWKERQVAEHAASMEKLQAEVRRVGEGNDRLKQSNAARKDELQRKLDEADKQVQELTAGGKRLEKAMSEKDANIGKLEVMIERLKVEHATDEQRYHELQEQLRLLVQNTSGLASPSDDSKVRKQLEQELSACRQELEENRGQSAGDKDTRTPLQRHSQAASTTEEMELVHYIEKIMKKSKVHDLQTKAKATNGRPAATSTTRSPAKSTPETAGEDEPSGVPSASQPIERTSPRSSVNAPFKSPLLGKASQNNTSTKRNLPALEPRSQPAGDATEVYDDDEDPQVLAERAAASASAEADAVKRKKADAGDKMPTTYGGAQAHKKRKQTDITGNDASTSTMKPDRAARPTSSQSSHAQLPGSQSGSKRGRYADKPSSSQTQTTRSGRPMKRAIYNEDDDYSSSA